MSISLSTYLTPDLIVLAVLIIGSLIYSFMVSHGKLVPILAATYMAFVLVEFVPFELSFLFKLVLFGVIFLVILFILSGVIFQSPVGAETFGWWAAYVFAFFQVGFLLAVFISFLPEELGNEFSGNLLSFFQGDTAFFIWAALPVLFLLFLGRRVNRRIHGEDIDEDFYYDED